MELANCSMRLHDKEAHWRGRPYDELFDEFIVADPFPACEGTLESGDDLGNYFDLPSSLSEDGSDLGQVVTPPRYPLQATGELGFACSARAQSSRYPSSNFTSIAGSISPRAHSTCSPPPAAPTASPVEFELGYDSITDRDLATALLQSCRRSLDLSVDTLSDMAQPSCSRSGRHDSWSQRVDGNSERYDINPQAIANEPLSPPQSTRTSFSTSERPSDSTKIPNFPSQFTPITPVSEDFNPQTITTYDSAMSHSNQRDGHPRSGSSSYYHHHHTSNPNTPYLDDSFWGSEGSASFTSSAVDSLGWQHRQQSPSTSAQAQQYYASFGTAPEFNHTQSAPQPQSQWYQSQAVFSPDAQSYPMPGPGSSTQPRPSQAPSQMVPDSTSYTSMSNSGLMIQNMQQQQQQQPRVASRGAYLHQRPHPHALPTSHQQHRQQPHHSASMPQLHEARRRPSVPSMTLPLNRRRQRSSETRSPSPPKPSSGSGTHPVPSAPTLAPGATTAGHRVASRSASTGAGRARTGTHTHTQRRARPSASSSRASVGFVNFTPDDSQKILTGVAPSGSSKTKLRREKEAAAKQKRLTAAARRMVLEAGGNVDLFEREGLSLSDEMDESEE